jgi:hypothetical protein
MAREIEVSTKVGVVSRTPQIVIEIRKLRSAAINQVPRDQRMLSIT